MQTAHAYEFQKAPIQIREYTVTLVGLGGGRVEKLILAKHSVDALTLALRTADVHTIAASCKVAA